MSPQSCVVTKSKKMQEKKYTMMVINRIQAPTERALDGKKLEQYEQQNKAMLNYNLRYKNK